LVFALFAALRESFSSALVQSTTTSKEDAIAGVQEVVLQVSTENFSQSIKVKRGDEFFAFADADVTVNGVPIPDDVNPLYRLPGPKVFNVNGVSFTINFIFLLKVGAYVHYLPAPATTDGDVRHSSLPVGTYDLKKEVPTFKPGYPPLEENIVSKFTLNQIYLSDEGILTVQDGPVATTFAQPLVERRWMTVDVSNYWPTEVWHSEWVPGPVIATGYCKVIKTGVASHFSIRVSKNTIEVCDAPPRFLTAAVPMVDVTLQGDIRVMGFSSRMEYDSSFGVVKMAHKTDGLWMTSKLLKGDK